MLVNLKILLPGPLSQTLFISTDSEKRPRPRGSEARCSSRNRDAREWGLLDLARLRRSAPASPECGGAVGRGHVEGQQDTGKHRSLSPGKKASVTWGQQAPIPYSPAASKLCPVSPARVARRQLRKNEAAAQTVDLGGAKLQGGLWPILPVSSQPCCGPGGILIL